MPTLEDRKKEMLSGKMYNDLSKELVEAREKAILLSNEYNASFSKPQGERMQILKQLLANVGENVHFEPGFRCEFGFHIYIGNHFYANFDCIMLDGGGIHIGDNVLIGPRVGMYTSNHAIDPQQRKDGGCYGKSIVIEDNVWIGAGVHINQGVCIGANSVIGSGSVVTKSIPSNVIAAGNPCRVIRTISEQDKKDYIVY